VNVLIVDDDRSTQRFLADALTKRGFVVTVERDGEWAVKTFEKKPFDLVLLDILLPSLNGYEVAKQMRSLPRGKETPIIMMSGVYKNAIHQREAVSRHGAFAFLEKPLDLDRLIDTLKEALQEAYPEPAAPKPPPPPLEEDEATGEFYADDIQKREKAEVEDRTRSIETASIKPSGPVIKGDFAQTPFGQVLAELYRWRASGALLLGRQKVKKIVYVRDGVPELVKSNLLVEALGRILVRERMITEAECAESLKRMKASKRMQGTVLIEMGCMSPHNLSYALTQQMQEKLFDVFRWDDGLYQFNPGASPPPEPVSLGMTTAQLIVEGIRRSYDEERLLRTMGEVGSMYVHPSDEPLYALQDAGLSEEEKEIALVADGHKTVATLRALNVLSALETDRLIYALTCAQMLSLKAIPATGKPKVSIAKLAALQNPTGPMPIVRPSEPTSPPPLPTPQGPPPLPPRSPHAPEPAFSTPTALPELPWENAPLARPIPSAQSMRPKDPAETPPEPLPRSDAPALGSLLPELSSVTNLPKLTNEEREIRERLAGKVGAMRKLDYFEILGIKRTATREDIKRAYFALAKEYHPDRHSSSRSAEARELAQQLYDLISAAHDTLADPTERERYVEELKSGRRRDMGHDVSKILAAEGKFQRGEEFMRQRQYAEAVTAFHEAVALYGEEGEFYAWLGWARFQANPADTELSIVDIEKAISLSPKLDKSYLFLGYIHKATGRPDKAEKQFEKAIQANPDCTEALRELRLLGKAKR
jgi:DNA-binding response OmpR family regulator